MRTDFTQHVEVISNTCLQIKFACFSTFKDVNKFGRIYVII